MRSLASHLLVLACAGALLAAAACGGPGDDPHTKHWLTEIMPAQHATYFPIESGAHKGMDCNLCHGAFDSFKGFSCTGCHAHSQAVTDPQHQGVTGYSYGPTICYRCHMNGSVRFDLARHQKDFPIGQGTAHDTESCSDCHTDPTRLGEKAFITCVSCHPHSQAIAAGRHHMPADGSASVGTIYHFSQNICVQCHMHGAMLLRRQHTADRTYHGNNVASGPHFLGAECSDCHHTRAFKTFTCSPCHDPGGIAAATTAACDSAKGSPCTDLEKYDYFYQ